MRSKRGLLYALMAFLCGIVLWNFAHRPDYSDQRTPYFCHECQHPFELSWEEVEEMQKRGLTRIPTESGRELRHLTCPACGKMEATSQYPEQLEPAP